MKAAFVLSLLLGFAACSDDDGDTAVDAQAAADANANAPDANSNAPDAMASAPLPFMTPCDVADDQCDPANGGICFGFNNNGPHCTHPCTDSKMCDAPSRGCGGAGVCRPPAN